MKDVSQVYQRIAPELMKVVEERYVLLSHISHTEPIGRRSLSVLSGLSERVVRSHVEVMKDNGLIDYTQQGMVLTEDGKLVLPQLTHSLYELNKIADIEETIRQALQLEHVTIASGHNESELAFQAARVLQEVLTKNQVIAVSGGSTMAAVAEALPRKTLGSIVIPARGGIGERLEFQANVIASVVADKLAGVYKMLHLPDGLSPDSLQILTTMEPQIVEVTALAKKTNVLVFGIGNALHMAGQRRLSPAQQQLLKEKQAVGEALGYYCDVHGKIIYAMSNVGIALTDVERIEHVIAVAGGASKAQSIIGVMRACHKGTLIIDEAAAQAIVDYLNK